MKDSEFSPLDRLIELGMGLSISRQMAGTMNHYFDSIKTPERYSQGKKYWFVIEDRQVGPFPEKDNVLLVKNRIIDRNTLSWTIGLSKWRKVEDDSYLFGLILLTNPN